MASATDQSLLSAELQEEEEEEEFRRLLLQAAEKIQGAVPPSGDSKPIQPLPGYCLKTHSNTGEKIFVNVCRSPHVPPPPDLTDEELECLIESENAADFQVPMTLGEPHAELDKSGHGCTAYDVTVNTDFFAKMESNQFFKEFFITIALEGLSEKYKMEISHEWRILKNRKFMGSISEQTIRTKSKPFIQEMDSSQPQVVTGNLLQHIFSQSSVTVPDFAIVALPSRSHPECLVMKISLPKMNSVGALELHLGEDRILLRDRPGRYHLDIFVPYSIISEESKAQFHKRTKILTVTMPIQRPSLLLSGTSSPTGGAIIS